MTSARCFGLAIGAGVLGLLLETGHAQQVTTSTPFNSVSDGFFERIGTSWGFNFKGVNARFGGSPNMAAPQFGGFDPSAGLNGGFAFGGRNGNGFFNFGAAQGSRRSFTSQVPSVTTINGQPGFFSDTSQSPFVVGQIPVVGGYPVFGGAPASGFGTPVMAGPAYTMGMLNQAAPSASAANSRIQQLQRQLAEQPRGGAGQAAPARPRPAPGDLDMVAQPNVDEARLEGGTGSLWAEAQQSSAGRAVPSVAEARRMHQIEQAADHREAQELFHRGLAAEEAGKAGAAKIFYRMVLRRAEGTFKEQVEARLEGLGTR